MRTLVYEGVLMYVCIRWLVVWNLDNNLSTVAFKWSTVQFQLPDKHFTLFVGIWTYQALDKLILFLRNFKYFLDAAGEELFVFLNTLVLLILDRFYVDLI